MSHEARLLLAVNCCERLAAARTRTDELFDLVRPDALYDRPIPERHRIIFYLGHLEAFDWNLLRERLMDVKAFHPELDQLFAFGIDPVGGGLPSDQPADWPSLKEVRHYTSHIRQTLDAALEGVLDSASESMHRSGEFPASVLLNVAIEHRLMHAETLTYMLHRLPLERKMRKAPRPELVASPVEARHGRNSRRQGDAGIVAERPGFRLGQRIRTMYGGGPCLCHRSAQSNQPPVSAIHGRRRL